MDEEETTDVYDSSEDEDTYANCDIYDDEDSIDD
tara:strand:- start:433 stop:534 length:102 start_codon:yes stop_codon:yes gene_type:complete